MTLDIETCKQLIYMLRCLGDERLILAESEVSETDASPPNIISEMQDTGHTRISRRTIIP